MVFRNNSISGATSLKALRKERNLYNSVFSEAKIIIYYLKNSLVIDRIPHSYIRIFHIKDELKPWKYIIIIKLII